MNCILIINDIKYSLTIEMILNKIEINLIDKLTNSAQALTSIKKNKPDIVLIDLELKGNFNSIDLAKKVSALNIPIVFMASLNSNQNFNLTKTIKNSAFLTKPIYKFDLQRTVELLIKLQNKGKVVNKNKNEKMLMKGIKQYHQIDKNKILFVKADKNYANVFAENNQFLTRYKLSEFETLLPSNFIRCHRSYIINLDCIQSVDFSKNLVNINNTTQIKINEEAKRKIENYFKILR